MLLVVVLLVLVAWPVGMVAHTAWRDRAHAEPGLTPREQRVGLAANTVMLIAMVLAVAVPVGAAAALLVFRCDLPGRKSSAVLLLLPALVPLDLHVTAWLAALGPRGFLGSLGLPIELGGLYGAAWVHAMAAIPWAVAMIGAAVRTVEPELEEDCMLWAGPLRVIWHVTLRRSAGAMVAAALVVAVLVAGEMAVTDVLRVRSYAETVYTEFAIAGRIGAATATALPGIGVLVALVGLAGVLVLRAAPQDAQAIFAPRPVFALGRWRWPALAGCVLVIGMSLGVPVVSLAWRAGLEYPRAAPQPPGATAQGPKVGAASDSTSARSGPRWSAAVLAGSFVRSVRAAGAELKLSLALAAVSASAAVALAWWMARTARRSKFGQLLAAGTACVLLALPGPVMGIGLSLALNRPTRWWGGDPESVGGIIAARLADVADSPLVLVWLFTVRTLPFALLVLWPVVRLVNRSLLDAARVDGAGEWSQFRHIELPGSWPAAVAAALVAAVLCLGEVSGSVIVAPPGVQPLSVRIFTLAHFGVENYLAGICLVLLVVAGLGAGAVFAALWWLARFVRRDRLSEA